jgi:surface polysaccharide O-acyltransferase-like enzyme
LHFLDPIRENAYGMYLVHYVFVIWLQYALLGVAIPAIVKGLTVVTATILLSLVSVVAIRRIPAAARVLGTGPHAMPGTG